MLKADTTRQTNVGLEAPTTKCSLEIEQTDDPKNFCTVRAVTRYKKDERDKKKLKAKMSRNTAFFYTWCPSMGTTVVGAGSDAGGDSRLDGPNGAPPPPGPDEATSVLSVR